LRTELKRRLPLLLLVGLLGLSTLLLTGCDSYVGVKGVAFEWVDAPADATSRIYITSVANETDLDPALVKALATLPGTITKAPLQNVNIAAGDSSNIQTKGDKYYWYRTSSNSTGEFEISKVTGPQRNPMRVKASKAGYMEAIGEAENVDYMFILAVVVILVKNSNQN